MKLLLSMSLGLMLFALGAFAESGVTGKVVDPQGLPVPGATVRLETAAGYRMVATTDGDGHYRFDPVADGG